MSAIDTAIVELLERGEEFRGKVYVRVCPHQTGQTVVLDAQPEPETLPKRVTGWRSTSSDATTATSTRTRPCCAGPRRAGFRRHSSPWAWC